MLSFLGNQILFYISLVLVLFLPGYFLLLTIFAKSGKFSSLEKFVLSCGLSIISVDFLMMILNRLHIPITRASLLITLLIFMSACFAIYASRTFKMSSRLFVWVNGLNKFFPQNLMLRMKVRDEYRKQKNDLEVGEKTGHLFNFSKRQIILIIGIIFLTIFIKADYLADNVLPSATDLGHHMYWAKEIAASGTIPPYAQKDIEQIDGGYQIGAAHSISDFIIGEHLIFAAIALLGGLDLISYFPILTLFAINLASILAIFILAIRFFEKHAQAKNIAILTLFLVGPLFAISPPQAKYVFGGVIGNIIGNLLVPIAFYFFYRALEEKNKIFATLAIFTTMGLFYTHHLTGFVLLFILALSVVLLLVFNFRRAREMTRQWLKIFFSRPVILFLVFALVFVAVIYTPSYLKNTAVNTVIGGPKKIEHQGLSFSQFKFTVGEPREALGLIGAALILFLLYKRRNREEFGYPNAFLFAWVSVIILISIFPDWMHISVPSARIGNYGSFPLSILASFVIIEMAGRIKINSPEGEKIFLNSKMLAAALILLFSFVVAAGFYDNAQNQSQDQLAQKTVQTFAAAQYLAKNTDAKDQILHDHVFITADSWIKLFFMRDYDFPFYRANFDRYTNGIDKKETCTLSMISTPGSADSQKCYQNLGIDFVMIGKTDAPQFVKENSFWQVYNNGEINTYYRP